MQPLRRYFEMHFVDRTLVLESDFTFYIFDKVPFHNRSEMVQLMPCHLFGYKPLREPMMTHFTAAYMHHRALASSHNNFCVMEKNFYDVIKLN